MQQGVIGYGSVYSQIHIADNPQRLSAYNVNLVNKHKLKLFYNKKTLFLS